jgi:shikimate dehydrogenase
MGVNTYTTRGLPQLKGLPVDADSLKARHVVVDLAYGDQPTPLLRAAVAKGSRVVDGLEVLVHQGADSLRIWTGADPPIETMRQAARQDVTSERAHGN